MATSLANLKGLLPEGWEQRQLTGFKPCARYFESMDDIVYLREDLPYRADRVDEFLTLLWHPDETRAIGVKIKGIRSLFRRLRAISEPLGTKLDERDFVPVVSLLELVISVKAGPAITEATERLRLDDRYDTAKSLIENATVNLTSAST
jgi:hypothetical protein